MKSVDQRRMVDAVECNRLIECDEYCRSMIVETFENVVSQLEESCFRRMVSYMQIGKCQCSVTVIHVGLFLLTPVVLRS
jgi:hypothetical protein